MRAPLVACRRAARAVALCEVAREHALREVAREHALREVAREHALREVAREHALREVAREHALRDVAREHALGDVAREPARRNAARAHERGDAARALATLVLGLAGCQRAADEPSRVLVHLLTRPANPDGVYLNEDLVFHFSAEVDRTSVTRDSVRIATKDGRPARGRLVVDGTKVRFVPAPVLAPDLSDGGYVPGAEYAVEIAGFPQPDGLRGVHGEPLRSTYRWTFRTVAAPGEEGATLFEDRDPGRTRRLRLFPPLTGRRYELGPTDAIYLSSEEPLDPSSLVEGAFSLLERTVVPRRPRQSADASEPPREVRLRPRLIENESEPTARPRPARARSSAPDEAWLKEPRASLVELAPEVELQRGGEYDLVFRPEVRTLDTLFVRWLPGAPPMPVLVPRSFPGAPRDLGGRPIWESLVGVQFRVVERGRDAGRGAWLEEFLDKNLRSTVAVPGADGTAFWGESGRVEVRFPRAAGTGGDGDVALGGHEDRRDVRAVRVHLPASTTCQLTPEPGPVVVRAQGTLRIAGRLERATGALVPMRFTPGKLSTWIDAGLALDAATAAREADWTVLIAGGDLVVEGEIDVSTPLLLVAGGRIRVTGTVRGGDPAQVFRLGEGGGEGLWASVVDELEMDATDVNLLREPLRFAVLSGPLPPRGTVLEWLEAEARGSERASDVVGHAAEKARTVFSGAWTVRYVPELTGAPTTPEDLRAVDAPALLTPVGSIQFLVELVVEPGPQWRPPFVDAVRLAWQETEGEPR